MKHLILILLIGSTAHAAKLGDHPHDKQTEAPVNWNNFKDCSDKLNEQAEKKITCDTDFDCASKSIKFEKAHKCSLRALEYYY